ncbi:MAG TPA: MmgE/PrpD family protein [Candidatus Acidoferrales bacterium]|nr:MmgE/PrpD family protein [Candidatus Acidoferrales bacterium]
MAPVPVTERLAQFIAESKYESISRAAVENAKLHILDTLGVALAGYEHPVAQIALDYCKYMAGPPEVTIWGSDQKASMPMGAFTNGILAHAIDFDDWDGIAHVGHPSCMAVSASLAIAEALGAPGKDFLKGYVTGIEVATQVSASCPADIHDRGFHSTPIFGSLGAVAAAASVRALDSGKTRAAFGIAASGASGLHRQQGSMVKPFHAANAARNGVEAVLLAERGFTADPAIIESPRGFCDSFFGKDRCDYEKMLAGLGRPYFLESPGLSFKLHPCSAPQFLAADATLHLVRTHNIRAEDVAYLELRINPVRHNRHYRPSVETGLQGKFTINYVAAVALLDGRLERASFYDAKVKDPKVQETFKKVRVVVDETIPVKGEYCPVTIALKDGRKFEYTATMQKGHAKNPLTEEEVLTKFRDNAKEKLSEERADKIIACVRSLESVGDVRELTALLAA